MHLIYNTGSYKALLVLKKYSYFIDISLPLIDINLHFSDN